MRNAQDFIEDGKNFDNLCRTVFSSGAGRELLELMKGRYVDSKLYQETDRATVYCIAQRDLVLELEDRVKSTIAAQGIPGGEDIS